jgi:hypothetical protein
MTFDYLAEKALFVCKDVSQPPQQWIYAVDDAWIHDGFTDEESGSHKGALFEALRSDVCSRQNPFTAESVLERINHKAKITIPSPEEEFSSSSSEPAAQRHQDHTSAETLITFIQSKAEHNYGLCFCTFEYFWAHIKEINAPENAVFFDIRHQLAASTSLAVDWQQKIKALGIFEDASAGQMSRLGLHLYFALKLGRLPQSNPIKCNIGPNHLIILSSRVFDKEPGKELLLQAFLSVQKEIWKATAKANTAGNADRQGLDFTFIPIPKTADDDLFNTGLEIFHNTFQNAASWTARELDLRTDMETIWRGFDQPGSEAWGHVAITRTDFSALRSTSWLPTERRIEALRCLYLAQWRREDAITVDTVRKFLQYAVDSDGVEFVPLTNGLGNSRVFLPTRPGILFVLGLGLFLRELQPGGKEGRVKPQVRFEEDGAQVILNIQINNAAIQKLKTYFFAKEKKASGATSALWNVALAQGRMLDHVIGPKEAELAVGMIRGPSEETLKEQLVKQENHVCLDVAKSHPIFSNDAILFRFPVAPEKTVGG